MQRKMLSCYGNDNDDDDDDGGAAVAMAATATATATAVAITARSRSMAQCHLARAYRPCPPPTPTLTICPPRAFSRGAGKPFVTSECTPFLPRFISFFQVLSFSLHLASSMHFFVPCALLLPSNIAFSILFFVDTFYKRNFRISVSCSQMPFCLNRI